jgi:hypothetical protein
MAEHNRMVKKVKEQYKKTAKQLVPIAKKLLHELEVEKYSVIVFFHASSRNPNQYYGLCGVIEALVFNKVFNSYEESQANILITAYLKREKGRESNTLYYWEPGIKAPRIKALKQFIEEYE